jgi:Helix-turn-helix domain
MKRWQAYQFQIEPNGEQLREMRQFAGNARKVWNLALHQAIRKFTSQGEEDLSALSYADGDTVKNLAAIGCYLADSGYDTAQSFRQKAKVSGEQGESFRRCNPIIQDSYLFGCETLACEIHELYRQLVARM